MTTDIRKDLHLSVDHVINAAPEVVYNAWLNPETLAKFMRPAPGMGAPKVSNDPREGGAFEIIMSPGDQHLPHRGIYRKLSPHDQIVFTWESAFSPAGSEVTIDLRPEGDGTHVTLTHVTFFGEEERDNHQQGWAQILATLAETLA
ncbi:SRPBCC family protein [Cognatishimia sp. SS12]|uniref:SRPBCC family protein n=1 Tax=Cognatishimia sp. SS12 TaxID=2979465 RepID=UPI00232BD616|nr:SRPBCC family protein [Cognatishimia sp. SS12]MDC0737391.1 SRPBCC family protein [Cognatishimia sp. SS12]